MRKISWIIIGTMMVVACKEPQKKDGIDKTNGTVTKTVDTLAPIQQPIDYNSYAPVDVSPMDISYFPKNYPQLKSANKIQQAPYVRVIYSRPHLNGRILFDEVLKRGEAWRLGANESTEIQLFSAATINGKRVEAGRYALYCVPNIDKWEFIFNKNTDSWGLTPDRSQDLYKFTVPIKQLPFRLEYLSIVFEGEKNKADMVVTWGNFEVKLPFQF